MPRTVIGLSQVQDRGLRQLLRPLVARGAVLTVAGSGHLIVTHPDHPGMVTLSSTAGDWRTFRNSEKWLRKTFPELCKKS